MTLSTATNTSKHVSWAYPLVKSCSRVHHQQSPSDSTDGDASQNNRLAAESLRDWLQNSIPSSATLRSGSRHDSLDSSTTVSLSEILKVRQEEHTANKESHAKYQHRDEAEKSRYARARHDREQAALFHDVLLEDPCLEHCWIATCKFTDRLASRNTEPNLDFLSDSDMLVCLFIHLDLTFYRNRLLVQYLLLPLIYHFPRVKNFRFAVFFSRGLVDGITVVPASLRYFLGTFGYMHRTACLQGESTEMEKKFVAKRLMGMRRARYDHVQIHEDSLDRGVLVPRIDDGDGSPMIKGLLQDAERSGTRPVDIVWPERKGEAWEAPERFLWP